MASGRATTDYRAIARAFGTTAKPSETVMLLTEAFHIRGTSPAEPKPTSTESPDAISPSVKEASRVRYGAGRGGFSLGGPALTTGLGGYFGGDPGPAPVRGESPLIAWTGPGFSPPVLTGTRLRNGLGRGQGQGTLKKHGPPPAVQRGGAVNWAGGRRFSGPRRPRNEH